MPDSPLKHYFVSGMRRAASFFCSRLPMQARAAVLEQVDEGMVMDAPVRDRLLRFSVGNPLLLHRACSVGSKEPDTLTWIDGFAEETVFWDIGANVGVFSLYATGRPGVRALAFEPSASNYGVLCRNIQLNQRCESLQAYCLALSGNTRLGVLNLTSAAPGAAVSEFGDAGRASRYSQSPSQVTQQAMIGFTVDEFLDRFSPPFPHHIKIDVDGLELAILQGATRTLADPRLRSLLVELNLDDRAEHESAVQLLSEAGLQLSSTGQTQSFHGQSGANHIFRRI